MLIALFVLVLINVPIAVALGLIAAVAMSRRRAWTISWAPPS